MPARMPTKSGPADYGRRNNYWAWCDGQSRRDDHYVGSAIPESVAMGSRATTFRSLRIEAHEGKQCRRYDS